MTALREQSPVFNNGFETLDEFAHLFAAGIELLQDDPGTNNDIDVIVSKATTLPQRLEPNLKRQKPDSDAKGVDSTDLIKEVIRFREVFQAVLDLSNNEMQSNGTPGGVTQEE